MSRNTAQLVALVAVGLLPAVVLLVLRALDVPLGKPGTFVYLYSPIPGLRSRALPGGVLIGAIIVLGLVWTHAVPARRRQLGVAIALIGGAAACLWAFGAPPRWTSQHAFNMLSPSQDGAFLLEARTIEDARGYLAAFPQRALTPPEQMRGTRVISNPPGTTLLALAVRRGLDANPGMSARLERALLDDDVQPASERRRLAEALAFAFVLHALWIAAGPLLLLALVQVLPLSSALTGTLLIWLAPAALLLAPGKDVAQLLTVAIPLWLWLRGLRRGSPLSLLLAGATATLACLVSLVHAWLALILLVAGAPPGARPLRAPAIGAVFLGAAIAAAALWALAAVDLPATLLAATRAQSSVTRGPGAMPLVWQALGIPLFLLFCGSGVLLCRWMGAKAGVTPPGALRWGRRLLLACAVVMIATVGFTNAETPRLWLPFVPLLVLGGLAGAPGDSPRAQAGTERSHALLPGWVLPALLFSLQWLTGLLAWTLLDMREAEFRLLRDAAGAARMFH